MYLQNERNSESSESTGESTEQPFLQWRKNFQLLYLTTIHLTVDVSVNSFNLTILTIFSGANTHRWIPKDIRCSSNQSEGVFNAIHYWYKLNSIIRSEQKVFTIKDYMILILFLSLIKSRSSGCRSFRQLLPLAWKMSLNESSWLSHSC